MESQLLAQAQFLGVDTELIRAHQGLQLQIRPNYVAWSLRHMLFGHQTHSHFRCDG